MRLRFYTETSIPSFYHTLRPGIQDTYQFGRISGIWGKTLMAASPGTCCYW